MNYPQRKKIRELKKRKNTWNKMPFWIAGVILLIGGLWFSYQYFVTPATKAAAEAKKPQDFKVQIVNFKVQLSWSAPQSTKELVKYRIERSTAILSGDYSKWVRETNLTSFVDNSVLRGETYWYRIFAIYQNKNSNPVGPIPAIIK